MEVNWEKINDTLKEFTLDGEEKHGKIVSVYDGDTVKIVFPIYKTLYKWNCRLSRVDTPELRTRNKLEKKFGYEVRDKLRERILNKVVKVKCGEFDKYGRLLTEIYFEDENINQWLIDSNYAFEYDGGTKKSWEEFLNNKNNLDKIVEEENNEKDLDKSVEIEK
jgi:endonuclease YncB( thermonuclease family)